MSDAIDPSNVPTPRGPWAEVTDSSRLYDHGAPWSAMAAGHPSSQAGYPNSLIHLPDECRSRSLVLDGVRRELTGEEGTLEVYLARSFRFGLPRESPEVDVATRVVIELMDTAEIATRYSLGLGDSLRLATQLQWLVTLRDQPSMLH